MARQMGMESLDRKIEKAEQNVSRMRAAYEAATAELKELLDKRDALKKDMVVKAIMKSDKSLDEILAFIGGGSSDADSEDDET